MSAGEAYQQVKTLKVIRIPVLSKIPVIGEAFFLSGYYDLSCSSACHSSSSIL